MFWFQSCFWRLDKIPSILNADFSKKPPLDFLVGVKRSKCIFRLVPFFLLASAPTALLWVVSWNISRELPETQREVERNWGKSQYHKESMTTWPHSNIKLGDWVHIKSQVLMQPNGSGYFSVAVNNFSWASWVTHHRYLSHCYSNLNCHKRRVSSLREAHCCSALLAMHMDFPI